MAMQTENPTPTAAPAPSAQVIGKAFVEQYYHILHQSPELVYRFYQDSSVLSRPEPNGMMTSVTTIQAINDKIVAMDYKDYKAEIKTADAQDSYMEGVVLLVTGFLTGKDDVRRKFTQSFFLAPQDKGYYVFNDVFRYVDENEPLEINPVPVNGINEQTPTGPLSPDPEPTHFPDHHVPEPATSSVEEDLNNFEEVYDPSNNGSVTEEEVVVESSVQKEIHPVAESSVAVQEDAPKQSYAAILKVMKGRAAPSPVYVPTNTAKVVPAKVVPENTEQQLPGSVAPASEPESTASASNSGPESSDAHEEAEGHSIYIRSLPLNATVAQLAEEFKKFGSIKHDGIQVRSNRQQGFCFGFVEFESLSSMHSAIEASPITIGGRQAFIEEKRTTTRVNSVRGRFPPGRGGFRNDNFRSRGNYVGGRSFGRSDSGNRGEFLGRSRNPTRRGAEGYQRVDHNGSGRDGRQDGMNQTVVSA